MDNSDGCVACGGELTGRQRKYCSDQCRKRYSRGARASAGAREHKDDRAAGPEGIQSTEAATMIALAEAGKLGTPGGQAAMVLARRIDASHQDTGAGLASMVKRLQETIAEVTADAKVEHDPLDEFTRRREEKLRAASG